MGKITLKKQSKRMTCRKKYKIAKKKREYYRKKRKEAKKLLNKPQKKLIHVPNICPFKEDILRSAAEYKKQKESEQKEKRKLLLEAKKEKAKSIAEIANAAQQKQIGLEEEDRNEDDFVQKSEKGGQPKSYFREFQKVVACADVILEVVDARDPLGTRCPAVEQSVKQSGENKNKRLVLVLNKADLVPREVLDKWIKYLRRSVPAIPFKSSTQNQSKHLGQKKLKKKQEISNGSVCVGAEGLTSLLANYCRNKGIKTSIRVGVVGLPNVGKSSLINSLKRTKSCKVGATPGITRSLQEVHLDSKIKLLDSPGLAFANNTDPHAALKNAVLSSDPITPAEMIIARANKEQLKSLYLVPDFSKPREFLLSLAKRYGRYKKGGVADLASAARILVDDWNRGKILYYVQPPENDTSHDISSSIVTSYVPEFDLESYDKNVTFEVEEAKMDVDSTAKSTDETQSAGNVVVVAKRKRRKKNKVEVVKKKEDSLMKLEGNLRVNKVKKVQLKKEKKQRARTERATENLVNTIADLQL